MTMIQQLPENVAALMKSGIFIEYATISAAGVPIDTPLYYFPSDDLAIFGMATGLSYPVKAERARKNPKVGLLVEGGPDEPVISIAGMAAVRDSNLQANAERYIAETGHSLPGNPPWSLAQKSVWYFTRIIVEVTPARVLWWDNQAAMDFPLHRWDAPADTVYPKSDPAPPGALSASPNWGQGPWQKVADSAMTRKVPGHLTLIDDDGYPLPIRARDIRRTDDGFVMDMPKTVPWSGAGKASLSFEGFELFIGEATVEGGLTHMRVDRVLPFHPLVNDPKQLWEPTAETYDKLMGRLRHETERRGVPIPTIPQIKPSPTEGAKLRMARMKMAPPTAESVTGYVDEQRR